MNRSWALLIVVLIAIVACGGSAYAPTAAPGNTGQPSQIIASNSATDASVPPTDLEQSLRQVAFEIEVSSNPHIADGPLPLKLRLTNVGDKPIRMPLGGVPPYDFRVRDRNGIEIWYWTFGTVVDTSLAFVNLAPAQEKDFTADWNFVNLAGNPVSPGFYVIEGTLNSESPWMLHGAVVVSVLQ